MLLFGSNDITLLRVGRPDQAAGYYRSTPVNWQAQSSAHALLDNAAGLLVYGGATIEYTLNAYAKTYGGASIEYILGGIVDAEFTSAITFTAPFAGEREVDAEFTSACTWSAPFGGEVEVDAEFTSVIDFSSVFLPERTLEAEFTSVITVTDEWFGSVTTVTGEVLDQAGLDAWVFTLGADAPPISRYLGFDFNSFAELGGRYYAAGDDGIYELGGENDDGAQIEGHIITGRAQQSGDRRTRMPILYLSGSSVGVLHCGVIDEDATVHDYTAERALGDIPSRERVKIGRGIKASFWQMRIGNEAGEDFELIDAGTLPDVLKRRVG